MSHNGPSDGIDRRLLEELNRDGRLPHSKLAARAGISEYEAHSRVERMVQDGTIARFTIERGDHSTSAVVLVSVESGRDTARISEELTHLEGAETIYEITGQYDILVIMEADTIPAINHAIDELRRAEGVADTNTVIILRKVR